MSKNNDDIEQRIQARMENVDVQLSVNPLLRTLVVDVYDRGDLVSQASISPSVTDKLLRALYPRAILTEQELSDIVSRAYNFFR